MIEMVTAIRHPLGAEDLICPALVCDVCRETIEKSGNIEWRVKPGGWTSPFYASHKWPCSVRLANALDEMYPHSRGWSHAWRPAKQFLEQLANNFAEPVAEIEHTTEIHHPEGSLK
jgi:hypothetical protein